MHDVIFTNLPALFSNFVTIGSRMICRPQWKNEYRIDFRFKCHWEQIFSIVQFVNSIVKVLQRFFARYLLKGCYYREKMLKILRA